MRLRSQCLTLGARGLNLPTRRESLRSHFRTRFSRGKNASPTGEASAPACKPLLPIGKTIPTIGKATSPVCEAIFPTGKTIPTNGKAASLTCGTIFPIGKIIFPMENPLCATEIWKNPQYGFYQLSPPPAKSEFLEPAPPHFHDPSTLFIFAEHIAAPEPSRPAISVRARSSPPPKRSFAHTCVPNASHWERGAKPAIYFLRTTT